MKVKDGSSSAGKRVLIDDQQRVTALMAALLGQMVVTKDYDEVRIRIAFNPLEEKFELSNPATGRLESRPSLLRSLPAGQTAKKREANGSP